MPITLWYGDEALGDARDPDARVTCNLCGGGTFELRPDGAQLLGTTATCEECGRVYHVRETVYYRADSATTPDVVLNPRAPSIEPLT